jgi:uncharacterized phage protein (TIGR01671 family)
MRKILFRGRSEGKWYTGDLVSGNIIVSGCPYVSESELSFEVDSGAEYHECEPGTIGQFTGLQDKNGQDIFEGDVLSAKVYGTEKKVFRQVTFNHGCFCLRCERLNLDGPLKDHEGWEKVGNIFEGEWELR